MTDQQMEQIRQEFRQVNEQFGKVNQQFGQIRRQMDERFAQVDRRFEQVGGELQKLGVQFEGQRDKLELIAESIQVGQDVTAAKIDELKESLAQQIDPLKALGENHEKRINALEARQ